MYRLNGWLKFLMHHLVGKASFLAFLPGLYLLKVKVVIFLLQVLTYTCVTDYNADAFDTTTVFSVVVMAGASAYAIYHTFWIYLPSQPSGRKSVGRFNRLILAYLISTLIASFTFDLMNAGKIWASFGVLHNLFEIALLASIFIRRSDIRQVILEAML